MNGKPGRPMKDWRGTRVGRLTVIERCGSVRGKPLWRCKCACGEYTERSSEALFHALQLGYISSCAPCQSRSTVLRELRSVRAKAGWVTRNAKRER